MMKEQEGKLLPKIVTEVPGPESRGLAAFLAKYESRNVTYFSEKFPVFWERACGANVWDVDGNRYVDFTSAFGVATPGFSDPHVRKAMMNQIENLWHGMGDVHPTKEKALLCARLADCTFGRQGMDARVVLSSSGFEAVEAALKTAHLATGRKRFLAFRGGYHGLGFGAVDVTGWDFFRGPFREVIGQCTDFLPYPGCNSCPLDALKNQLETILREKNYAAVIVEPVQGRGGVIVPPKGFLKLLRDVTSRSGTLLIFDEIFTGFWRTGHWLACDDEGVLPDMLCLGKAMGGGFPISACVGTAEVMDCWPISSGEALHTSTHLGNPLGCAMALAALDVLESEATQKRVRETSVLLVGLADRVAQHCKKWVRCVRGRGLFWGIELKAQENYPASRKCAELMCGGLAEGLLLLGGGESGSVLTLSPPAGLTAQQVGCLENFLLRQLCG